MNNTLLLCQANLHVRDIPRAVWRTLRCHTQVQESSRGSGARYARPMPQVTGPDMRRLNGVICHNGCVTLCFQPSTTIARREWALQTYVQPMQRYDIQRHNSTDHSVSYLFCACQIYQGVECVQPILAGRALRQASDMEEREAGHCLIWAEESTLLQTDLQHAAKAMPQDCKASGACLGRGARATGNDEMRRPAVVHAEQHEHISSNVASIMHVTVFPAELYIMPASTCRLASPTHLVWLLRGVR